MTKLRILVADDHPVIRAGVRWLLESRAGCEVCGEAITGRQAVALAQELNPDIVVLDIAMPELNGVEAARQIVKTVPGTHVLIFSGHESEQLVRESVDAGAEGYVLKSDAERELTAAVQAVRQGEPFFTPGIAEIALQAYRNRKCGSQAQPRSGSVLTAREREVLQLLAEAKSSKEVATTLGISVPTAETHRANIMSKLNLHSIAELVRYAVRNQITAV
ncbi:MAG TPA: response regulator transcription factor [Verrucomicrobiae bacterium]|nr:response regulator transcription factor [Verrucomicrobiae bacterium]